MIDEYKVCIKNNSLRSNRIVNAEIFPYSNLATLCKCKILHTDSKLISALSSDSISTYVYIETDGKKTLKDSIYSVIFLIKLYDKENSGVKYEKIEKETRSEGTNRLVSMSKSYYKPNISLFSKIPLLGIVSLILGAYLYYTPNLEYDKVETKDGYDMITNEDGSFNIKFSIDAEFLNKSFKVNNVESLSILPSSRDSAVTMLSSTINKEAIYPFQTKVIRIQFWVQTREFVAKRSRNGFYLETYPIKVFFADKHGSQIRCVNKTYFGDLILAGQPVLDFLNGELRKLDTLNRKSPFSEYRLVVNRANKWID